MTCALDIVRLQLIGDVADDIHRTEDRNQAEHHGEATSSTNGDDCATGCAARRRGPHDLRLARIPAPLDRHDAPVPDMNRVVGLLQHLGVMRGEDERHLMHLLHPPHQLDDLDAGLAVEVGRRLVGKDELRLRRPRRARSPPAGAARPDSCPGRWRAEIAQTDGGEETTTRWRRFRCGMRAITSGYSTFSYAVNTGRRLKFWKTKPRCWARKSESSSSDSFCTAYRRP